MLGKVSLDNTLAWLPISPCISVHEQPNFLSITLHHFLPTSIEWHVFRTHRLIEVKLMDISKGHFFSSQLDLKIEGIIHSSTSWSFTHAFWCSKRQCPIYDIWYMIYIYIVYSWHIYGTHINTQIWYTYTHIYTNTYMCLLFKVHTVSWSYFFILTKCLSVVSETELWARHQSDYFRMMW